jgi:response regulator RpfG family c-di-GMP phosphodiesterase/uncharacterized membrane protein YwzB
MIAILLFFISCWQLYALREFIKKNKSTHLRLLFAIVVLQIFFMLARLYLSSQPSDSNLITNLYDETAQLFYIRMVFTTTYFLLFIFTNNYFYEALSIRANQKVILVEEQMLSSLNALSLARDNETGKHIVRTQNYVKALAIRLRALGHYTDELSLKSIDLMFRAAPLHDIGKVGIRDSILCKSGQLTSDEWGVMRTHPLIGEAMLKSAALVTEEDDIMSVAIKIAGGHHEKWDGTGYPRGLKSDQIPLAARIMSLSDVYDALVSERVYKKKWTHEQAFEEIVSQKGIAFDPAIVDAFVLEASNFRQISGNYPDDILLMTDKY